MATIAAKYRLSPAHITEGFRHMLPVLLRALIVVLFIYCSYEEMAEHIDAPTDLPSPMLEEVHLDSLESSALEPGALERISIPETKR